MCYAAEADEQQAKIAEILKQAAIELQKTSLGKDIQGESNDAMNVVSGHADKVSEAHQNVITELGSLMAGHAVSLQRAAALINNANQSDGNFLASIQVMGETMQALRTGTAQQLQILIQTRSDIAALSAEIDNIKQRINGTPR